MSVFSVRFMKFLEKLRSIGLSSKYSLTSFKRLHTVSNFFNTSAFVPIYFAYFLHNRWYSSLIKTTPTWLVSKLSLISSPFLHFYDIVICTAEASSLFNFQNDVMKKKYDNSFYRTTNAYLVHVKEFPRH